MSAVSTRRGGKNGGAIYTLCVVNAKRQLPSAFSPRPYNNALMEIIVFSREERKREEKQVIRSNTSNQAIIVATLGGRGGGGDETGAKSLTASRDSGYENWKLDTEILPRDTEGFFSPRSELFTVPRFSIGVFLNFYTYNTRCTYEGVTCTTFIKIEQRASEVK